ncbi:hypothetical protein [Kitasatospora sp. NPDC127116]|uniref:hypothetical protein n=1 Tax=Kitasatospora sp. NPDC127116 TaxID=3345367 RepID=UPI00362B5332
MALVSPTRITDPTAQEPLLTYDLVTSPDPLKASPEDPATPEETGELIITASRNSGTPADVEWIKVKVPAGTMSPDLATNLSSINPRITLNGWNTRREESYDEIIFTPTASHETIGPDNGFTIQLSQIPINRKVGTAQIEVTEHSREGENGTFKDRITVFNVGKFPADFYMKDFKVEGDLVIGNGCEATLTWQRSTNATYELLYGNTNLNVTNETTRKITDIRSDTTFYLRGTTSDDPTNPVTRILTAQVTVRRPDLDIGNLTVHGETNFNNIVRANCDVTVTGTLNTEGPTDLTGSPDLIYKLDESKPVVKKFIASTAGLVVGLLAYGRTGNRLQINAGGIWHEATKHGIITMVVAPVRREETFLVSFYPEFDPGGQVRCEFWWFPFGRGRCSEVPMSESELEEISEATLRELPLTPADQARGTATNSHAGRLTT